LAKLFSGFAAMGLRRDGYVIAFGGGVIGDLAGLAAALWMRGVPVIQVPTTLLAMVDSAVGGKTAINISEGKNLVGAFHQPSLVVSDISMLETLSNRDYAGGMAEIIKYGLLFSEEFLENLIKYEVNGRMDSGKEATIIRQCCEWKTEIVAQDEREAGQRMLLNLGHTFGHAIETLGNYTTHTHGEAVAIGMVLAARAGERLGITRYHCEKLIGLLERYNLPTQSPYSMASVINHMAGDKKAHAEGLRLILFYEPGRPVIQSITTEELRKVLM
ncbi:MAG: 3-dehydroquinate synthase, partial [Clostridia bacterium]|nr:3-dehydroquinate synthase [Clostridia bacterium]